MAKSKKYECSITSTDGGWAAEIIRRKTSKETVVSKRKDGFKNKADAEAWGEKELVNFMNSQKERNKRQVEKRSHANK